MSTKYIIIMSSIVFISKCELEFSCYVFNGASISFVVVTNYYCCSIACRKNINIEKNYYMKCTKPYKYTNKCMSFLNVLNGT